VGGAAGASAVATILGAGVVGGALGYGTQAGIHKCATQ